MTTFGLIKKIGSEHSFKKGSIYIKSRAFHRSRLACALLQQETTVRAENVARICFHCSFSRHCFELASIANVPKHAHGTIGGWSTHLVGTVGGMSSAAGEWKKLQIRGSGEGKEDWSKSKDVGNDAEYYPPYYRLAFIIKL